MTILHFDTRDQWLAFRQTGIGGSDAPVIAGLVGWSSPYKLALAKRGLIPEEEDSVRMSLGRLVEPWARKRLAEETGWSVDHPDDYTYRSGVPPIDVHRSDVNPWQFCTPDGVILDEEDSRGLNEIKSVGWISKEALEDPESEERRVWDTQLQHGLACTGFTWGVVSVIIGNQRFAWYRQERNEVRIAEITAMERAFWEALLRGEYPEPDGTEATDGAIRERFKRPNGKPVSLGVESVLDFEEWERFNRQTVESGLKAAKAKQRLMAAMGESTFAVLPNGVKLSWKADARGARVLRRVK